MEKEEKTTMESIKTVEDAFKATGMPATPEFSEVPEELRAYFKAVYEVVVITRALVGDWKPDWTNWDQPKWFPWFDMQSSGAFVFDDTDYATSIAGAGYASRLCFPTEELAEYAGRQFTDIYSNIILK